jgi:hypothetical protein
MTTIRKGGWRSTQRSKLSASRGPHESNPEDFYYDAQTAPARLADAGPIPDALTRETELARARHLSGHEGVSWRGAARNFTREFWNPLIGLWVDRRGLDFALDLLLEGVDDAPTQPFIGADELTPWIGMRRYLFAATEEDYAAAKARAEPVFEGLFARRGQGGAVGHGERAQAIAFAFSRGTSEWADRFLSGRGGRGHALPVHREALAGATLDPELALRAFATQSHWFGFDHVFDMVESLGGEAIPAFDAAEPRKAWARKRLAQAREVAEAVAAL